MSRSFYLINISVYSPVVRLDTFLTNPNFLHYEDLKDCFTKCLRPWDFRIVWHCRRTMKSFLWIFTLICLILDNVRGFRILVLCPHISRSHFTIFEAIAKVSRSVLSK
uniref:Uncharacterized protein n=1 Tax=Cacopsylla melanoneura TaxID=428564 RepID=A0A8D8S259_9HEMI